MYHLIVYTPLTHAEAVRAALAEAGAGHIGQYDSCSFSSRGQGRFRPLANAKPFLGKTDQVECVEEERIEAVVADRTTLATVLQSVIRAHPYEEPAIHVLPMQDYKEFLRK